MSGVTTISCFENRKKYFTPIAVVPDTCIVAFDFLICNSELWVGDKAWEIAAEHKKKLTE